MESEAERRPLLPSCPNRAGDGRHAAGTGEPAISVDGRVVARILGGEREAFRLLVERYQQDLLAYVGSMILSPQETEDLVQQGFINAFRRLDRFDRRCCFLPWLKTIARNLVYDQLRRRRRRGDWLDAYRRHLLRRSQARDAGPDADGRLGALAACLEQLPDEARAALRLRYGEDQEMEAIGARIGRSPAATQRWLSRLRAALRQCIQERTGDHD